MAPTTNRADISQRVTNAPTTTATASVDFLTLREWLDTIMMPLPQIRSHEPERLPVRYPLTKRAK